MSLTPVPALAQLLQDPGRADEIPAEAVPRLLGELEQLKATLWTRLIAPARANDGQHEAPVKDWLTIPELARRLRLSCSYLYQLARRGDLPVIRLGKRHVRVRVADLREWEARLGKNPLDAVSSTMLHTKRERRGTASLTGSPGPHTSAARRAAGGAPDHARSVGARPGADSDGGG